MSEKKPKKRKQCEATFTFHLKLPMKPSMTFACMREKHTDGKHEHRGLSKFGGEYKVSWTEPQTASIKSGQPVFIRKESETIQ